MQKKKWGICYEEHSEGRVRTCFIYRSMPDYTAGLDHCACLEAESVLCMVCHRYRNYRYHRGSADQCQER